MPHSISSSWRSPWGWLLCLIWASCLPWAVEAARQPAPRAELRLRDNQEPARLWALPTLGRPAVLAAAHSPLSPASGPGAGVLPPLPQWWLAGSHAGLRALGLGLAPDGNVRHRARGLRTALSPNGP
ncbi:hypothetical protein [Hymenobacter sp. B81]|uniref:hypothetical protein n=1 Tax=Hymenobacter sp. B81 TaxID=3344878 RepID=UPI0037DDA8ED